MRKRSDPAPVPLSSAWAANRQGVFFEPSVQGPEKSAALAAMFRTSTVPVRSSPEESLEYVMSPPTLPACDCATKEKAFRPPLPSGIEPLPSASLLGARAVALTVTMTRAVAVPPRPSETV